MVALLQQENKQLKQTLVQKRKETKDKGKVFIDVE